MLKTKIVNYNELPEDLKRKYYRNSFNSFILVYYKNRLMAAFIFNKCRDSSIPDMIEKAYKLGLRDGNSLDYLDEAEDSTEN